MASSKICIKNYKYNIYKALKNHSFTNYLKARKYNAYRYWKLIDIYITKKYYISCSVNKKKYLNYKNLFLKCTFNNKFILFYE